MAFESIVKERALDERKRNNTSFILLIDLRARTATFFITVLLYPKLAFIRFRPTSSQPFKKQTSNKMIANPN